MKKIKIAVACHKPSDVVKNNVFVPVQVGAALTDKKLPGMCLDNEGDNISEKNKSYCEMTAHYWLWKNVDAEYYGLFHYRRYLEFKESGDALDCWKNICTGEITEKAINKYGLDEKTIDAFMQDCDILMPKIKDITTFPGNDKNIYDQYMNSGYLHMEDLQMMMDIIKKDHPKMYPYAEKYMKGKETYLNNMFVMKKEFFVEYSEFAFDVMDKFCEMWDPSDYSIEAIRTPGHLAERLINIYVMYIKANRKDVRIKEMQTVAFLETDPKEELKPCFEEGAVVALSVNELYVPYVSALLLSIAENANVNRKYEIIIMHRDISKWTQERLLQMLKPFSNIVLRFFDVRKYNCLVDNLHLRGHFATETYFRLLMPEIMPNYKKVLYLDSDMIVKGDVAVLYDTDIEGCLLGAAKDPDTAGLYNGFEPQKKQYMDEVLKIKKPYEYFQAGTVLLNLEEFRKTYTSKELLEFAASNQWELLDQDVLNYFAQGKVRFVDMAWNVMIDWRRIRITEIISRAPKYLYDEYMAARKNPMIIHYAGPDKPWGDLYGDFADDFWFYARKSPFYEELVRRIAEGEWYKKMATIPHNEKYITQAKKGNVIPKIYFKLFPEGTKRRTFVRTKVKSHMGKKFIQYMDVDN